MDWGPYSQGCSERLRRAGKTHERRAYTSEWTLSVSTYNDYLKCQEYQNASAGMDSTFIPCLETNDNYVSIKQIFVEHLHRGEQRQVEQKGG